MKIRHLNCDKDTKLFPIIGYPMAQSSASYAYNPLFEENDVDEIMWPVEIRPGHLPEFMASVRTLGIKHFALTMPHKSAIIPLLDEVDQESRLFNSVNIVKIDENGRTFGVGMDGKGNIAAIENAGVDVKGMHVFILGAGSIVGVILLELATHGAKKVTLVNRSLENAQKLKQIVNRHSDMEIECFPLENSVLDRAAESCNFFMQSTPLGLKGFGKDHEYLGFLDKLSPRAIVMENIVNPPHTALAKRVEARGLKLIYGVDMMLGQIGQIFEFCFGRKPTENSMRAASKSVCAYFQFNKKI